jgi:hypothetical protein
MLPRRTVATVEPAQGSSGTDQRQIYCAICARKSPQGQDSDSSIGPQDRHLGRVATENITVVAQEAARLLDRIAVTIPEAAILTGMPEKRIRQAIYARELPVVQFTAGKEYYIAVDDLRKWFNDKKRVL